MFIWGIGKKISLMGKGSISMLMDRNTKEGSRMERNQVGESTRMMGNGSKIKKMGSVYSITLTIRNIKETGLMGKNTEKELTIIRLEISTLDNGLKIKKMETEYYNTRMEQFMMGNG
jgi:hypothetical protein